MEASKDVSGKVEGKSSMSRSSAIETAKALVVCLVVLGHILEGLVLKQKAPDCMTVIYRGIYLFHMPFYFLLSGYLYRGAQPIKTYFLKKAKHLLVPYFSWILVFSLAVIAGLLVNLVWNSLTAENIAFYKEFFTRQAYGGPMLGGIQMVFWFPVTLFFSQQLVNVLIGFIDSVLWRVVSGLLLFIGGYCLYWFSPDWSLPLSLHVVLGATPFFLVGIALRNDSCQKWFLRLGSMALVVALVSLVLCPDLELAYAMRKGRYGLFGLSALAAVGAFLWMLKLTGKVRGKLVAAISVPIAAASMTIMYAHAFVLVKFTQLGGHSIVGALLLAVSLPVVLHFVLARILKVRLFLLRVAK